MKKIIEKIKNHFEKDRNLIYGELTYLGVNDLIKSLDLKPNDKFTFLDIGSGYGKVVTAMQDLFINSKCFGIEIVEERFEIANKINANKKAKFIHGDIKNNIKLLKESNIVYTNSILFSNEDMKFIVENFNGVLIHNNSSFKSKEIIELQCSWIGRKSRFYKINTITNR